MPLTIQDVVREVRATLALQDLADDEEYMTLQCCNMRGDAICDRHYKHHGPHAHLTGIHVDRDLGYWVYSRLVTWK